MQSTVQSESSDGQLLSVAIVGIVRNIEKSIKKDYERFTKAFSRFGNIDFFVVESGSTDNSIQLLERLSNEKHNFKYQSLAINNEVNRTSNMATARNAYLSYLREDSLLSKYQYIVVADFNNLNNKLDKRAVDSCWSNGSWDVVTANQSGRYYDIWALRHPIWSPNDCWEALDFYRKYIKFPEEALSYALRTRSIRIPKNAEWIQVDSAFGGLAIYKSELFDSNASYRGLTPEGKEVCEHVSFNRQINELKAKIYVNPQLINTRITDHTRRLSFTFTMLRILRYPIKFFVNFSERNTGSIQ
jgi:glycosyltransferase involved in cell wall biosynthesis